MVTTGNPTAAPPDLREHVVAESIRLFSERGYEATTVDDVAAAAGTSRRTLFRQFGSKEGLIFADHESLLEQVGAHLAGTRPGADDPWWGVCEGAELVFAHFSGNRDLARRRYAVVSRVPLLRDRELVMVSRYQRLFERFLYERAPQVPRIQVVSFAAAVTGAHNDLLRRMSRGDASATAGALETELRRLRARLVGDAAG